MSAEAGPFIVTRSRPCADCGGEGWQVEMSGVEPGCCGNFRPDGDCCGNAVPVEAPEQVPCQCDGGRVRLSVKAVADLEARTLTREIGDWFEKPSIAVWVIQKVAVGYLARREAELPDGSVVEVEARDRNRMLDEAGVELASIKTTADNAEVCAIWNAEHGVGGGS